MIPAANAEAARRNRILRERLRAADELTREGVTTILIPLLVSVVSALACKILGSNHYRDSLMDPRWLQLQGRLYIACACLEGFCINTRMAVLALAIGYAHFAFSGLRPI